jgi:hypothetical protein
LGLCPQTKLAGISEDSNVRFNREIVFRIFRWGSRPDNFRAETRWVCLERTGTADGSNIVIKEKYQNFFLDRTVLWSYD